MRLALPALIALTITIAACASNPTPAPIPTATQIPAATPTTLSPANPTQTPAVAPTDVPAPASPSPTLAAVAPVTPTVSASLEPKQVVQVQAFDDFFRPQDITVTVGTRIDWINLGKKKHTVTNDTLFDTDLLVGQTFSFTFDKPGTYQYYCVIHSESPTDGMVGTVTVVGP